MSPVEVILALPSGQQVCMSIYLAGYLARSRSISRLWILDSGRVNPVTLLDAN